MISQAFNNNSSQLVLLDNAGRHVNCVAKGPQKTINSQIINNQNTSNIIDLDCHRICGFVTDSAMTSTSISFLASINGIDFYPLYDANGNKIETIISASRFITLNPALFFGIRYLKILSNLNEAATRNINIVAEA